MLLHKSRYLEQRNPLDASITVERARAGAFITRLNGLVNKTGQMVKSDSMANRMKAQPNGRQQFMEVSTLQQLFLFRAQLDSIPYSTRTGVLKHAAKSCT